MVADGPGITYHQTDNTNLVSYVVFADGSESFAINTTIPVVNTETFVVFVKVFSDTVTTADGFWALWIENGTAYRTFGLTTDGKPFFTVEGVSVTGSTALSVGWHMLACYVTPTGMRLRVDKVDIGSASLTTSSASTFTWQWHGDPFHTQAHAGMSNLAYWTSALSDAQTDSIYDAFLGVSVQSGAVNLTTTATLTAGVVIPVIQTNLDIVQTSEMEVAASTSSHVFLDITQSSSDDMRVLTPVTTEPLTGVKSYRVIIVDEFGNQYGEVESAVLSPVSWAINDLGTFSFTASTFDPKIADLNVPEREVQVWRNGQFLWWGVVYRAKADVNQVQFQCSTVEWYFNRRVMGLIPRTGHLLETHFEGGTFAWTKAHMPDTLPAEKPDHEITDQLSIAGGNSLRLASTNLTVHTDQVSAMFTTSDGDTLTHDGYLAVISYAQVLVGNNPRISVQVHSGGDLDDDAADDITQAQADAIGSVIENYLAKVRVDAVGMGNQYPIYRTDTPTGQSNNRRVVITFLNAEGANGQYVSQSFILQTSAKKKHRIKVTMRGWVYLDTYVGPAMHNWGMVLERQNPRALAKDDKYANKGYNRVMSRRVITITDDTVKRRWIRVEASLRVPSDGKKWKIEGRMHCPSGVVFWDETDIYTDDALDFVNVEQAHIIKALVEHAQDINMGKSPLNIGTNVTKTGVKRTRRYPFAERSVIGDNLNEFSSLGDGMEWDIRITPTTRTLTTYYPRKAQPVDYPLVLGKNVLDGSVEVDGSDTSSVVAVMMNTNDTDAREERAVVDTSILDGLVLETVYLATPGSSLSSLLKQAQRGIERYRKPVTTASVIVRADHADEALQRLFPGAIVPVDVRAGWFETIADHRVTKVTLDPATDQITLDLVPEDTPIKVLSSYGGQWRYTHAVQGAVFSHPEYAAYGFNDSGWSVGMAGFGWTVAGDGSLTPDYLPVTTFPNTHEVWIRKVVPCTEEMYVNVRNERYAAVYVNGVLLHVQKGRDYENKIAAKPIRVPSSLLDPSGHQVVTINGRYLNPGGSTPYALYLDARVRGIFNPDHVVT
jgi:hypothetical protein